MAAGPGSATSQAGGGFRPMVAGHVQPDRPSLAERSPGWWMLKPRKNELVLLSTCFLLLLLAWFPHLQQPSYSPDDYVHLHRLESSFKNQNLGQGRFGLVLLLSAFELLGVQAARCVSFFSALALFLFSVGSVALFRLWKSERLPWFAFIVPSVIFMHPYFAEMWGFRGVPAYFGSALVPALIGLIWSREPAWPAWAAATALFVWSFSVYQVVVNACAIVILLGIALDLARSRGDRTAVFQVLRSWLRPICVFAIAAVAYVLIFRLTIRLNEASPEIRSQPLPLNELGLRYSQIKTLFLYSILRDQLLSTTVLTSLESALLVLPLVLALWQAIRQRSYLKLLLYPILLAASLISVVGVQLSLQVWWPMPRTLIGLGFVLGGFLLLGLQLSNRPVRAALLSTAAAVLVGFVGIDQAVFRDQVSINMIDRDTAQRVFARLENQANPENLRRIVVLGYPPASGGVRPIGDANISALFAGWSQTYLFEEVTGKELESPSAADWGTAKDFCARAPKWPDKGSTTIENGTAFVCF